MSNIVGFNYPNKQTVKQPCNTLHGKQYELQVIQKFGYKGSEDPYARWDAGIEFPVSVKTLKLGHELNLGSFRHMASISRPHLLHVGFWQDQPQNIVEEYRLLIFPQVWNTYLGNTNFINYVYEQLGQVNHVNDAAWKQLTDHYKQSYGDEEAIIKLRFSRNKKKPGLKPTLKCAISYKNFMEIVVKQSVQLPLNM